MEYEVEADQPQQVVWPAQWMFSGCFVACAVDFLWMFIFVVEVLRMFVLFWKFYECLEDAYGCCGCFWVFYGLCQVDVLWVFCWCFFP